MLICKVIGTVVSTRKNENLVGSKLLVVETIKDIDPDEKRFVAVDQVGAGIGDFVLVTMGSSARAGVGKDIFSADAAIIGIIDNEEEIYITR